MGESDDATARGEGRARRAGPVALRDAGRTGSPDVGCRSTACVRASAPRPKRRTAGGYRTLSLDLVLDRGLLRPTTPATSTAAATAPGR